jgi:hypothetical protein
MRNVIRAAVFGLAVISIGFLACTDSTTPGDDGGNGGEVEHDYTYPPFRVIRYSTNIERQSVTVAVGNDGIAMDMNIFWGHRVIPTETRVQLNDVWVQRMDPDSLFIVGDKDGHDHGLIYRLLNGRRLRMNHPISGDVTAVHGTAWNNVFAVGNDGAMARYDGERWRYVTTADPGIMLYDVWTGKHDNAWAVGSDGAVIHYYDDLVWREFDDAGTRPCFSVWGLSPDTVYVAVNEAIWRFHEPVGAEPAAEVMHTNTRGNPVNDIHVTAEDWAVAVGYWGLASVLLGAGWTDEYLVPQHLTTVVTDDQVMKSAVAFGHSGAAYLYTEATGWDQWNLSHGEDWADIHGTTEIYGILGGNLMRYENLAGGWVGIGLHPGVPLMGLFSTALNQVWALPEPLGRGEFGDRYAYFFNGAGWQGQWLSSMSDSRDIWCQDWERVCIVGDDGSVWYSAYDPPPGVGWYISYTSGGTSDHLNGVWAHTYNDVLYAVGDNGAIVQCDDQGVTWTPITSGTDVDLHDVWGWAPDSLVAVGDGGTVLFYDGASWASMSPGITEDLHHVWAEGYNEIWAADEGQTVVNWDGSRWLQYNTELPVAPIRSVWGDGRSVYFACGNDYMLYVNL